MEPFSSIFAFDASVPPEDFCRNLKQWNIEYAILHPGFFATRQMHSEMERNGIRTWLNLPVFDNAGHLENHPEDYSITSHGNQATKFWCHFVCPQKDRYLEHQIAQQTELIKRIQPEIISLDFIRYFVFWELVDLSGNAEDIESGCYCPDCLNAFEKEIGAGIDRENLAEDIRRHYSTEWGNHKVNRIKEVVQRFTQEIRAAAPSAQLTIKTIPWRPHDLDQAVRTVAGQDVAELAPYFDFIVPMVFSHELQRNLQWKSVFLEDIKQLTGKPVASYLQTSRIYVDTPLSNEQFSAELDSCMNSDYIGMPVFCYEQLLAAPDKARVLQAGLMNRPMACSDRGHR